MSDKMKKNLWTLGKSVFSAIIVFISAIFADKIGDNSSLAVGASIATAINFC